MIIHPQEKLCSLDSKGRVRLPSNIISQLSEEEARSFVLKHNLKKGILQVFTTKAWERRTARLMQIDTMIEENEEFVRRQMMGASSVDRDGSGRIQIPKHVIDALALNDSVMVTAWMDKIEIWPIEGYNAYMSDKSYDSAEQSKRIFGKGQNAEE